MSHLLCQSSPSFYSLYFNCMQKRDTGSATMTCSDGGNSSLTKSVTVPSTPLKDGINFPSEQRTWNSMLNENVPSDLLSVDLGKFSSDSSPVEETLLVQSVSTFSLCLHSFKKNKMYCSSKYKTKSRRKTEGELNQNGTQSK